MKAKEVLKLLRITRQTLHNYVEKEIIKYRKLPNGYYDYNEEDVYKFLNKDVERMTYIYARVSTPKQRRDLENQVEMLKQWCFSNGYKINGIFSDTASGISFDKRDDFFKMLDEILQHRVKKVIVAYKDRLSRVGFELFKRLFSQYGTEIVVVSEVGNKKLDAEEVFEEIISLLHCYSMKLYSRRRHRAIEVGIENGS